MPRLANIRYELFAQKLVQGMSALDAYEAAGYIPHDNNASRLKHQPYIQQRVNELLANAAERVEISASRVLQEMAKIAFYDTGDYFEIHDDGTATVDLSKLTRDQTAAITEIVSEDIRAPDGTRIGTKTKIKLADKKAALETLGKHFGLWVERTEHGRPGDFTKVENMDELHAKLLEELGPEDARAFMQVIEPGTELMPITHAFVSTKGDIADSSYVRPTNWNAAHVVSDIASTPTGRLTLTTATPVLTSTVSAATTIYYTPYVGNTIGIYDGTNMASTTFTELSVATTDTTKSPAAIGASKVNDWFVWNDSGTLRIGHGPDWTDDTTRSAGTALVRVNGIWMNNASITNGPAASRGTYVGTTRSNSSSQLDWILGTAAAGGGAASFGLWNAYNRVNFSTCVQDSNDSWTCPTGTVRPLDNSTTNRVSLVVGLQEDWVTATLIAGSGAWTFGGPHGVTIGFNSTTTTGANCTAVGIFSTGSFVPVTAFDIEQPLGFNYLQALESNADGATMTFYGDYGYPAFGMQAGLTVHFRA